MERKEVVMITGMSGAGKTTAMAVFENMEYYCIDNFPSELLIQFIELIKSNDNYNRVVLAVNLSFAYQAALLFKKEDWIDFSAIFLDANDDVILKRYKESRRTHPEIIKSNADSLMEGILIERKKASKVIEISDKILDTSVVKPGKLQEVLESYYTKKYKDPFRITFVSYGYKHGIPKDLDLMFDTRFLPNPYYIEELRYHTGNDEDVYNYVMEKEETKNFVEHMIPTLSYLFKQFSSEGRMHLVVGFGCTGGQHRSVTLTNFFADYFSKYYKVNRLHRDADH